MAVSSLAFACAAEQRFVARGAEVQDRQTGSIWQRCTLAQRWDGVHCIGRFVYMDWDTAHDSEGGGWRLPTVNELNSLLDRERRERGHMPAIDTAVFLDIPTDGQLAYWTSDCQHCVYNPRQGSAATVDFGDRTPNYIHGYPINQHHLARFVRGSAVSPPRREGGGAVSARTSDGRFILNGDVALDTRTGLSWERCNASQTMTDETMQSCGALILQGQGSPPPVG